MQQGKREVAEALTKARESYGEDPPSYATLEKIMWKVIGGDSTPTGESLRQWHHTGVHPTNAPIEAMRVLAQIYGVTLHDIHPTLGRRWATVKRIVDDRTVASLVVESYEDDRPFKLAQCG
jgi:antitoxin component HigA of HigAB toxin-antitoxin module